MTFTGTTTATTPLKHVTKSWFVMSFVLLVFVLYA
jgi:hypothetical protein